jgi:rhodanese-related sulfurtransferase
MIATITPRQLAELREAGKPIELVDVRTPAEFRDAHVEFARNVPLDELDLESIGQAASGGQPVYLICRSGRRSLQACEKLQQAGLTSVVSVEGGTQAWDAAGLPIVRGASAMSLERQVRIAAGLLVVIGALLGYFVHPYLIALAAFVGAGLVYSGVTDRCGMAVLLVHMPWNQTSDGGAKDACCGTH